MKVLELRYLDELCEGILKCIEPDSVEIMLRHLLDFYGVLNYEMSYDRSYWRARKCCIGRIGYDNTNELGAPPAEITKAGRMNEPKQPMLYLSTNQFSVLEEIGSKAGDIVHIIAYRQKIESKLRCAIVGEITNVHRWGRAQSSDHLGNHLNRIMNEMNFDIGRSYVYTDSFLSSLLRDKAASKSDYLYSRKLSKLIFEKHPSIDSIVYPGVALEGSMNFAVKPNVVSKKFDIGSNFVVRVNKRYKYGIFDFEIIKRAKGQYLDGTIVWQDS
ncbi:hypothetical protein [Rheinheimera sp. MMS21-TC3]|uniref:hypothetical protein n=1 Tax=Rheinheimera sp. MMS21-TC3 TaxID=3072790 RepID=UPI0028C4DFDB|nr:hypothetical protein [Rheinheimera sp. MMS21-TC3]WNO61609.1 hypothetical protein RDV63_11835 [Rheinheimera sp. MMS21-TC3]